MKIQSTFLLLLAFFICSFTLNKDGNEIRFIAIQCNAKMYMESGEEMDLTNYLKIAFYKQYRVYAYRQIREYYKEVGKTIVIINDSTEEHNMDMILDHQDTTYQYVVIKKGERLGLKYEALDGISKAMPFNIDSANSAMGLEKSNFLLYNHSLFGEPVDILKDQSGKVMLEKLVVPKSKKTEPDSIYRYYDERLKDIDFSFVPELDKRYKSKAVKLSMVFNPIPKSDGMYQIDVPRNEPYWEMKEINEKNPEAYLQLIERFKKDSKAMDLSNPKRLNK